MPERVRYYGMLAPGDRLPEMLFANEAMLHAASAQANEELVELHAVVALKMVVVEVIVVSMAEHHPDPGKRQ